MKYVLEVNRGATDQEVLKLSREEDRILLTVDKDFGEMIFRMGRSSIGVVFYRLDKWSMQAKIGAVANCFQYHGNELLGAFTVISQNGIRIRKLL
ncbi:MAG: DUF5615 family PIN-like protein [Bacteroidia bacterium]|nr:DUF5615 family PIN-like protein [Bacteroidia bacterium]